MRMSGWSSYVFSSDLVAAGGDGTINGVVNGLAGGGVPLALLPLGTANVLAAEIGLEESPAEIVRAILRGPAVPIHLGDVNGRHFTLMAGIGLDADVVAAVNPRLRSEEHTSELPSLMRSSYAVFCLKKKHNTKHTREHHTT